MRRPDPYRSSIATVSALALAGSLLLAGQAVAQEAAAPRYMNWNGRGPAVSQQTKRLKAEQAREVERMRRPGFWQRLWQWLLDQIQVG